MTYPGTLSGADAADPVPTFITDSNNKLERVRHEIIDLVNIVHNLADAAMGPIPEKNLNNPNLAITRISNTTACLTLLEEAVADLRREVHRFLLKG